MVRTDFKMVSLNVRGLSDSNKRLSILTWLKKSRYDIVLLQETHSTQDVARAWENQWKGPAFFSHGTSNSKGCCILISENVEFKPVFIKVDDGGRFIVLKCCIDDELFSVINVYAPYREEEYLSFIEKVTKAMSNCSITNLDDIIMGGDWKVVRDIELD